MASPTLPTLGIGTPNFFEQMLVPLPLRSSFHAGRVPSEAAGEADSADGHDQNELVDSGPRRFFLRG